MNKIKWVKNHASCYSAKGVDFNGCIYKAWAKRYALRGVNYWQVNIEIGNYRLKYCANFATGKEARIAAEIFIYFNYETDDDLEVNIFKYHTGDAAISERARVWFGDYG